MSKYMQLTIHVRGYYPENFAAVYPKLAHHLNRAKALGEEEPSLYDLVGRLDKLLYALDGNPACKDVLIKHKDQLKKRHAEIESHMADWNLSEADKALYQIEDIFEQIEWELDNG